jgi:two-component sensor histidine kinase
MKTCEERCPQPAAKEGRQYPARPSANVRSHSLSWHFWVLSLLVIAPITLVGLAISAVYVSREKNLIEARATAVAQDAANLIDNELQQYVVAAETLAASDSLARGDLEATYRQFKGVPLADYVTLHEQDGRVTLSSVLPLGQEPPGAPPAELVAAERKALETGRVVISELFTGRVTHEPVLAVAKSASWAGRPTVINLGFRASRIAQIVPVASAPADWLYGVTENNGRMIFRSWRPELIGQQPTAEFLMKTKGSRGSFPAVTLEGVPVQNFYTRSRVAGWVVSVAVPQSALNAPYYQAVSLLAAALGVGALVSLVVSRWYAQRLLTRVQALETLSRSKGNLPTITTGVEEFDGLAATIRTHLSALHEHERDQQTMINELNHRVKNTLALVRSLARLTRQRSQSVADFGETFEARLLALAKSHDLLRETKWNDVNLSDIIKQSVNAFAGPDQVKLAGPPLQVLPGSCVNLCMLLHELATNATKYGALSTDRAGWVSIEWSIQQELFHLVWKEHVPPLPNEERKTGFGSELLTSLVERAFGGSLDVTFEPDGIFVRASMPSVNIVGTSTEVICSAGDLVSLPLTTAAAQ